MTPNQEDALYEFLMNVTEPFTLEDVTAFVQMIESRRNGRLAMEIAALIDSRNLAFHLDSRKWVSRRGCFEPVPFVINPTRLELLNGILIPGHRCVPFVNTNVLPHEYVFIWKGSAVPVTTTEGPPEEFYPYYCIFGEEYAPQYVARDNPENESAFNCDPYEDPPEVSIHTLDMRNIYRETSFVPGDRFVVRNRDWKNGVFELEKVGKDEWSQAELYNWFEAAEAGFEDSFALLGPGLSTEEQIAYAYWYGGKRMREVPAYSLEDFLYEKTDRIEIVPYGIETRFWFAGKDISDTSGIQGIAVPPDRTILEDILFRKNVPVSEYVIVSYVRDALFRNERDISNVINRIIPPVIRLEEREWNILADYVSDTMEELEKHYTLFADQSMGPIRQRVGELHTAVLDLAARLQKGDIDPSWLPRHTFIVLSQIQGHAAGVLEDLDSDEAPPESELEAMDNALDSMIETYGDIKEFIDDALDNFRRNNLSVVRGNTDNSGENGWHTVQFSVSGAEVWRRVLVPESCSLEELYRLIQACLDWKGSSRCRFTCEGDGGDKKELNRKTTIAELRDRGVGELLCEYGTSWSIWIILLSPHHPGKDETIRCVAGAGAAPPEAIGGPLRFRKILGALETGSDAEKQDALHELGPDFVPELFDMERCNRNLNSMNPVRNYERK
ncbi:MAG: plasmid pRiA4b ORF-3 family protein [Treponema sp.]|jgi:hypothetical protein|nr:plasmid pRiA4b ORF-3 family protein [Treponema sp.]